jgi:hypothetical protein
VLIAPALPLALIHPSAQKGYSANFVLTALSEVRNDNQRLSNNKHGPSRGKCQRV